MLEKREYTITELEKIINSNGKQAVIIKKLMLQRNYYNYQRN